MTRIAVALAVIGLALLPPSPILAQRGGASAADSIKYKYPGSPKLEALKPAEKHLLRMGPTNARAVVKQLEAFRAAMAEAASSDGGASP